MKASITSVVQVEFPRGQSSPRYGIESKRESSSKVFMRADRSAHVQDLSSRRRSNSSLWVDRDSKVIPQEGSKSKFFMETILSMESVRSLVFSRHRSSYS